MPNVQRHIWRQANPANTHQPTRTLQDGSYIVRCRHADGSPYRPQAPALGRIQRVRECEAEAPARRRQRISAYAQQSTRAAEPAVEHEESMNQDPSTAAPTLLSTLGILWPMLFSGAENRRELPSDNSPSQGGEAPGRNKWRSHGHELARRTEDRRARESAPGKGDWSSNKNEPTHRGWHDRGRGPTHRYGKGGGRYHSTHEPSTPPRSGAGAWRKGGKGERQSRRRSPCEITLNVSPGVRINVSRQIRR